MKAYDGVYPYAFMSYSHKDDDKIRPLIDRLQRVGCNIWYDEGIIPLMNGPKLSLKNCPQQRYSF